jgi:very-short-patch-repair endonuclease
MRTLKHKTSEARKLQLAVHARFMRWRPTESEARLWERLRGSRLGVGFRRQYVIAGYIVDFAAPSVRLVVEVDGGYLATRRAADARRDAALLRAGWRVVRVSAAEVLRDVGAAAERVAVLVQRR